MNVTYPFTHPRYQIKATLGKGGMGIVYQAFDRLTRQSVALKQVSAERLLSRQNAQGHDPLLAFATEFRVLASLRHPHIVPVLDYGFDANRAPYYTMTLLDGAQSLMEYGQAADESTKTRLMVELLQALLYLHRRGIVHRDLKPTNVLVTAEGRVQVLDFGLALPQDADTQQRAQISGTLAYMAPELFGDEVASRASDLYAVGVMLYELWVGRHPFASSSSPFVLMDAIMKPVNVTPLPPPLRTLVASLLAKTAADRPSQAEDVLVELCYALDVPPPPESLTIRESFLQASTFVGREAEFGILSTALDEMMAGRTAFWLLGGESGVGKSRLLDELQTHALVKGALVLRGQAVAEGGLPYQLWRELARRLALETELSALEAGVLKSIVPDIEVLLEREITDAPQLPGKAMQERLVATLVELLNRQTAPLLVLLEDLQWAVESLVPWRQLVVMPEKFPRMLVVGTYRSDERPTLPQDLPGTRVLMLPRLSDTAIKELAQSMLGDAGRNPGVIALLERETEGNAFFMVETVRALAEEAGALSAVGTVTPLVSVFAGGVQRIVQRRLEQLPEAYHPRLRWAAVAGRQLDVAMLTHLADAVTVESFISVAANISLLEQVDGVWRFAHDKLREGVLHTLTADELSALHRAIAEAIEATYPADPSYYKALLRNWRAAGDVEREQQYLLLVVELLEVRAAYDEAKPVITRGLALLEDHDPRRVALLRWHAQIAEIQGDYAAAWQSGQEALAQAQRWAIPAEIAANLRFLGSVSTSQGNYPVARDYLQQSLDGYRSLNDQRGIARTLSTLGLVADYQGEYVVAYNYYQQSLTLSRVIGDQRGIAMNLTNLGAVTNEQGDFVAAQSHFQQSLALSRIVGDQRLIAMNLTNLGAVTSQQGDFATAQAYYEQSLALFRASGDQRNSAASSLNLGIMASRQSDFATAQGYYKRSLALFRTIGDQLGVGTALSYSVALALEQGASDLLPMLQEGMALSLKIGLKSVLLEILVTVGRWAALQHTIESARLAGLIERHPSMNISVREPLSKLQRELEALLPAVELAQYKAEGIALDLETTAREWLARIEAAL